MVSDTKLEGGDDQYRKLVWDKDRFQDHDPSPPALLPLSTEQARAVADYVMVYDVFQAALREAGIVIDGIYVSQLDMTPERYGAATFRKACATRAEALQIALNLLMGVKPTGTHTEIHKVLRDMLKEI